MSDTPHGGSRQPDVPDEEQLRALDAYIDALAATGDTTASPGSVLPGPDGPALASLVDRLGTLPESVWDDAVPSVPSPPRSAPPATDGRAHRGRRRPTKRLSRRILRPSAAVAVVAVVVAAVVLTNTFSGQPPPRPVTGVTAVPAAWRLAGFIYQPAWQAGGSAAAVGISATVTCPTGSTCYAVDAGNDRGATVVEVTTDGGSSWQASSLPTGSQTTSGVTCPTVDQCLVAGYTGAPAGSGAPGGGSPSILATTDGGATWSVQLLPSKVAQVVDLACASPSDCVGAGYGPAATADSVGPPVAVLTTDGGSSWTVVSLPGPVVFASPGGLVCPTTQSCVLVGATSFATPAAGSSAVTAVALYTTDGGRSWSPAVVPTALARIRAVSCADSTHCVAIANGPSAGSGTTTPGPYGPSEALTSTDGGRTWSLTGFIGSPPASLTSISCPTATECWAAGRMTDLGVIMATSNAGATWTPVQLPTALTPVQRQATGLLQLDTENVSSVSCPTSGTCVALGAQGSTGPDLQIVLTSQGS